MAASNSSRSRGVKIEHHWWGHCARGTREALIQHGITREWPFPGDPGEKKTTCKTIDPLGREISIRRASKTTFSVYRDLNEEEKAAQEQSEKCEKELRQAKELVASWPRTTREYRDQTGRMIGSLLDGIEREFSSGMSGGYRLHDSALNRVYELTAELRGMVEAGGVVMDLSLREQWTPDCIAEEVSASGVAYADNPIQCGGNVVPFRKPCQLGPKLL
ncbi:MAG: hypothetical protein BGP21_06480 [Thiobacillus sp. 65-29]|nr:MAG: hypothetical protein BGP21_06480 [Thiobacillus sp. 65-29]